MLSHNFTYTYTDTTHTASCSQNCGYVGTAEGHTFVVEEYSDNNHVLVCSTCGYTVVEAHDLDYTNESTHHSIECTVCDYTSAAVHAILYAKVNVNYHNKYCGNCTYSVAEAHTWTQSGALYSCGYCGQVSSFIPVVPASLSAGVLSQLMAVPAAEGEITVAFVDGVQYAMLDGQIYLVVECE
ncbi:MAG: hypothetical protein J6D21_00335 [Clostridia bacterium]|nr:hypothetical protein [Clostridia bacterium]